MEKARSLSSFQRSNVSRVITPANIALVAHKYTLGLRQVITSVWVALKGGKGRFQSRVERMFASGIERKRGVVFEYRRRWLRPASEPYLRPREDFLHYIYVSNRDCTIAPMLVAWSHPL